MEVSSDCSCCLGDLEIRPLVGRMTVSEEAWEVRGRKCDLHFRSWADGARVLCGQEFKVK